MLIKKNSVTLFAAVLMICFLSLQANANDSQKRPYQTIKTAELKALWDTKPKDLLIIDTRNLEEYGDVHIPGAINIPQKKFDAYTHLLPGEKAVRLVFYCNGLK